MEQLGVYVSVEKKDHVEETKNYLKETYIDANWNGRYRTLNYKFIVKLAAVDPLDIFSTVGLKANCEIDGYSGWVNVLGDYIDSAFRQGCLRGKMDKIFKIKTKQGEDGKCER